MVSLTFNEEDERFWCKCTFNDHLYPKTSGFRWHPDKKLWYTDQLKVAARLRRFADPLAEKEIAKVFLIHAPWTGRIDHPKRCKPKPWQIDATMYALERNRSYLALDPRLGKTPVAAMIINSEATNAIYICPPFMVETTRELLQKWLMHGLHAAKFRYPIDSAELPNILIVPDNQLQKPTTQLAMRAFIKHSEYVNRPVRLIVDEAHRFKNPEAKRTASMFDIAWFLDKITYMSGTPRPNRNMELYGVLNNSAPETIGFMNEFEFGRRYCDGKQVTIPTRSGLKKVWDFTGSTNGKELSERIKPFMLRIRRKDVGQLPKIEETVIIDDTLPPTVARLDKKLLEDISPDDVMNTEGAHVATYRKELGLAKAPFGVEYIKSLLDDTNENLLVFAWHRQVVAALEEGLEKYDPLVITGATSPDERQDRIFEFQNLKEKRLLISNIQAGGIGFDISKADRVIFVEFSYVPGDNDQAADRSFHLSKTENVFAQYLVYKNSVDRTIIESMIDKRKTEAQL